MNRQEYVDLLAEQIRNRRARQAVTEEIKSHLNDQIAAYKSEGMSDAEAELAAVQDMGDPVEAGASLDMIHKPKMEWKFFAFVIFLSALSVFFAWNVSGYVNQIFYSGLGILCMTIICCVDYTVWSRFYKYLGVLFLLFMIVEVFFAGIKMNGAVMWASAGPVTISLWSVMYLFPPIYGAILFANKGGGYKALLKCIVVLLIPVWTAFCMPSLSLAVSILLILLVMLTAALAKGWFCVRKRVCLFGVWGCLLGLPIAVFQIIYFTGRFSGYQMDRLRGYTQFTSSNFANIISQSAAGKMNFTMSADYLITYLIQYYGVIAGAAVIALLAFLIFRIFRIAANQPNQLGQMIGLGCGLVLAVQFAGYVMMNFGLIPDTTVYLPLFSIGGASTIVGYSLIGIVMSIYRYQNIPGVKQPGHRRKNSSIKQ